MSGREQLKLIPGTTLGIVLTDASPGAPPFAIQFRIEDDPWRPDRIEHDPSKIDGNEGSAA